MPEKQEPKALKTLEQLGSVSLTTRVGSASGFLSIVAAFRIGQRASSSFLFSRAYCLQHFAGSAKCLCGFRKERILPCHTRARIRPLSVYRPGPSGYPASSPQPLHANVDGPYAPLQFTGHLLDRAPQAVQLSQLFLVLLRPHRAGAFGSLPRRGGGAAPCHEAASARRAAAVAAFRTSSPWTRPTG